MPRHKRQCGAGHERDRRAEGLPERSEHDAGREGAEALHGGIPAKAVALQRLRRQIRDERFLAPLDRAK